MDTDIRKKLLSEWQNKKKEIITHPYLNEKVEWGMVPFVQAMLLARYLREIWMSTLYFYGNEVMACLY